VLPIVRPGGDGAAEGLGWAVAAGCFYGAFLTASRWLVSTAPALTLLFSQLAIPAVLTAPLALFALPPLTPQVAGLATASALGSMAGNFLLLFAYRMAPATALAPLVYFQLVAATGLGWAVFGTLPQGLTWLGLAVVIASGVAAAALPSRR
jgi:drug/metabolite transporter (DMT)-like permease